MSIKPPYVESGAATKSVVLVVAVVSR